MALTDRNEIKKRTLPLFFIIGTSESMYGKKIGSLNVSIRETLYELKNISDENPDGQIKIAVMEFSSGARWITDGLVDLDQFRWTDLEAGGMADFGEAFKELDKKLQLNDLMKEAGGIFAPIIIFISDSIPTDDWQSSLNKLKCNNWFKLAIKAALSIGSDANEDILKEFTGNSETVLKVHTPVALRKLIKFVSVSHSNPEKYANKRDDDEAEWEDW